MQKVIIENPDETPDKVALFFDILWSHNTVQCDRRLYYDIFRSLVSKYLDLLNQKQDEKKISEIF